MAFYLGEDVVAYISTDDDGNGVSMSATGVVSQETWSSGDSVNDFVAPPLAASAWSGTESDTGSSPPRGRIIENVAAVEPSLDKEIEELELLGRITKDKITIRRMAEISITRLAGTAEFGKIYEDADFGILAGALQYGRSQNSTESGYRIYLQLSPTTGSGQMWITGRNLKISAHSVAPTPSRTVQETITFKGEIWDIDTQPVITVTTTAEL